MKFSAGWGGPALPRAAREIQERANALLFGPRVEESRRAMPRRGLIERIDPRDAYLERVRSLVNLEMIREARLKVVIDPLYGSAQGYVDALLAEAGCDVSVLHNWRGPAFRRQVAGDYGGSSAGAGLPGGGDLRASGPGDGRGMRAVRPGRCGWHDPGTQLLPGTPPAPLGGNAAAGREASPDRWRPAICWTLWRAG